jgi:hypothetical protein
MTTSSAAQLADAQPETTTPCFASITMWQKGDLFIEVHHGQFETWEDAEFFASEMDFGLEERFSALFLRHRHESFWIPDAALHVFRGARSANMTIDDVLEEADLGAFVCIGMGHTEVQRGKPIQIREQAVSGAPVHQH